MCWEQTCDMFFSHRPVYKASPTFPVSTRAIDSVCNRAVFSVSVTFPFGTSYVTNIWLVCHNNTSFSSELHGDHAGGGFNFWGFFKIWTHEVKDFTISRKVDLWPIITESSIDLGSKAHCQSPILVQSNAFFLLSSTTLSSETPGGWHQPLLRYGKRASIKIS